MRRNALQRPGRRCWRRWGLKKGAYDWRQEHLADFEREILAYQKNGIEMFAFWGVHDDAFRLFEKYTAPSSLGKDAGRWTRIRPSHQIPRYRLL